MPGTGRSLLVGSLLLLAGACADEPIRVTSNACTGDAPMADTDAGDAVTVNSDDDNAEVDDALDEEVGATTDAREQQILCDEPPFRP